MIQMQTNLDVADNSGARRVMCIKVLGGSKRKYATSGTYRRFGQRGAPRGRVKKGEVMKAVVVRVRKDIRRADGSVIRFDSNAAVLINPQMEPVGTRIFGPVPREIARQEPYEDHFAGAGGASDGGKDRKGDTVVVICGRDKGRSGGGDRSTPFGRACAGAWASTWSSATRSRGEPRGRHRRQGILRPPVEPRAAIEGRQSRHASASRSWATRRSASPSGGVEIDG